MGSSLTADRAAAPAFTARSGSWGILGGTFDPVHHAHLAIAEQTRETLGLEGVLFVPAAVPVHRPGRPITPVAHRIAMLERAIADNAAFRLSRIEADRPGPSYTVDTLELLHRDAREGRAPFPAPGQGHPGSQDPFVFILSVEALAGFVTWREPQRILQLTRLAVVPRAGYPAIGPSWVAERLPGQEDRLTFLDAPELSHSASTIRRLAAEGRSVRYLVPDAVARYIAEHRPYGSPGSGEAMKEAYPT